MTADPGESAAPRLHLACAVVKGRRFEWALEKAVELGVLDRFSHDPAEAVAGADMVFIAVPLGAMRGVFAAIRGYRQKPPSTLSKPNANIAVLLTWVF